MTKKAARKRLHSLVSQRREAKRAEIEETVVISQAEAQLRYEQMQREGTRLPPFTEIGDRLTVELRDAKKARLMGQWVDELRDRAHIRIDENLILKY